MLKLDLYLFGFVYPIKHYLGYDTPKPQDTTALHTAVTKTTSQIGDFFLTQDTDATNRSNTLKFSTPTRAIIPKQQESDGRVRNYWQTTFAVNGERDIIEPSTLTTTITPQQQGGAGRVGGYWQTTIAVNKRISPILGQVN